MPFAESMAQTDDDHDENQDDHNKNHHELDVLPPHFPAIIMLTIK